MKQRKFERLGEEPWYEFHALTSPRCPHCGHSADVGGDDLWRLYEEGEHEVSCPRCELDYAVSTRLCRSFSTDRQPGVDAPRHDAGEADKIVESAALAEASIDRPDHAAALALAEAFSTVGAETIIRVDPAGRLWVLMHDGSMGRVGREAAGYLVPLLQLATAEPAGPLGGH